MTSIDDDNFLSIPTIVLPVLAKIKLTLMRSGIAKADGKETITVNAVLDDAGDYNEANPAFIGFQITSGSATFLDETNVEFKDSGDQKYVAKATNSMWSATVHIVDSIGETGTIVAFPYTTNKKPSDQADYTFINALTNLKLERISPDNVPANDIATITIQATLLDSQNIPAADKQLTFSVPNTTNAFFGGEVRTIDATTDANGVAQVKLHANSAVDITATVTCTLKGGTVPTSSLDLHFKGYVPVEKFTDLKIQTTKDHAKADGTSQNEVLATLKDAAGLPGKGITLTFTLPTSSPATFADGSKTFTHDTDENGQVRVELIAKSIDAFTTTVICSVELNADVTANTDVNFDTSVITPGLSLVVVNNNAIASAQHNDIKAIITLAAGTPSQTYALRFSFVNRPSSDLYITAEHLPPNQNINYTVIVNTSGDVTNVVAYVWDVNVALLQDVTAIIQAELWTIKDNHVDKKLAVSNNVSVTFKAPAKPPAPPVTEKEPIIIQLASHNAGPTGGTAVIRTVYKNSGALAPNTLFRIQGGSRSGGPVFTWTGGGYPNTPPPMGNLGMNVMEAKTGANALVTLTWRITPATSVVMGSTLAIINPARDDSVTGDVQLYP